MDFYFYSQVWATYLSESERKLLTQFLPTGTGAEQVVHSMLEGENYHFGNPYAKWQVMLRIVKICFCLPGQDLYLYI